MRRTSSHLRLIRPCLAGALLLAVGCSSPPAAPAPLPPPVTVSIPPPVTISAATPTVVTATLGPTTWTMPDLVGSDLQEAQDAIQELTDFEIPVITSHDETGAGREQLFDRNWKVCTQSVPAGEEISRTTRIDFGTVKTEERC
jgi:beta-lactam-binding protein with PASTA domain